MTDKAWETLDLVVVKLTVLKFVGMLFSPSVKRSRVPASDFAASSRIVETTVDEAAVAMRSVRGLVIKVTSDPMEWVFGYRGLVSSISCNRGRATTFDPISLSGLYCRSFDEQSRTLNLVFSGVSGVLSEELREAGRFGNCLPLTGPYRNVSYCL